MRNTILLSFILLLSSCLDDAFAPQNSQFLKGFTSTYRDSATFIDCEGNYHRNGTFTAKYFTDSTSEEYREGVRSIHQVEDKICVITYDSFNVYLVKMFDGSKMLDTVRVRHFLDKFPE